VNEVAFTTAPYDVLAESEIAPSLPSPPIPGVLLEDEVEMALPL